MKLHTRTRIRDSQRSGFVLFSQATSETVVEMLRSTLGTKSKRRKGMKFEGGKIRTQRAASPGLDKTRQTQQSVFELKFRPCDGLFDSGKTWGAQSNV